MNQSPIEPGGSAWERKWRIRCATTLNGTCGTPQVASTAHQGVAANVAEYYDTPLAALRCFPERMEFLPECRTAPEPNSR